MNKTTIATLSSVFALIFAGTTIIFWNESASNQNKFKVQQATATAATAGLEAARKTIETTTRELNEARQQGTALQKRLDSEVQGHNEARQVAKTATDNLVERERKERDLNAEIGALTAKLATAGRDLDEAKAFAAEAHDNENAAREDAENAVVKLDESRKRVDDQNIEIATFRANIETLEKSLTTLRAENARLRSNTEAGKLQSELDTATDTLKKRDSEISDKNDKIRELEDSIKELREELAKKRAKE